MKNERNDLVIKLRPLLKNAKTLDNTTQLEGFQNNTLRPIIKFQHELLIIILRNYLSINKMALKNSTVEKLTHFISIAIKNDKQLNLQIVHNISGFFTTEEFKFYFINKKEIHKRILQICTERYLTHFEQLK
jgi:hypothetical protein